MTSSSDKQTSPMGKEAMNEPIKDETPSKLQSLLHGIQAAISLQRQGKATLDLAAIELMLDSARRELASAERRARELGKALKVACPDDIEETCDECAPGPCAGCWVVTARRALTNQSTKEE